MCVRIFYNNILFIADVERRQTRNIGKDSSRRRAEKSDESERESY
jgi:hypothetical protein